MDTWDEEQLLAMMAPLRQAPGARNFVVLGAPFSGKGFTGRSLSPQTGGGHLISGDLVRAEIEANVHFARLHGEKVQTGELVPTPWMFLRVVGEARKPPYFQGIWWDGFPRTGQQARLLSQFLAKGGLSVELAINLLAPDEDLLQRVELRRQCMVCERWYGFGLPEPRADGRCHCGGVLLKRKDDNVTVATRRIATHRRLEPEVLAFYRELGLLREVTADNRTSTKQLLEAVCALIGVEAPAV
jgi:adenylate kinase